MRDPWRAVEKRLKDIDRKLDHLIFLWEGDPRVEHRPFDPDKDEWDRYLS